MSDCIIWTRGLFASGYGRQWVAGTWRRAHIVAYEAARGPIRELARRAGYVCADRIPELTWPAARLVLLPPGAEWWLQCHAMGHWLAYQVRGVDDPAKSERLAQRAEGPSWLTRLFGRRDPWEGKTWT